eukprot:NODE_3667_length_1180_cov_97.062441_g3483_i0.p1 GENE.NODE_3667_length_1180_cov_97.062441_g3483_i0~~NODE_3667_length_1180_cov_97.062441_g3483_i0.p1  ORF type:complete len:351 (-),score=76.95 NODE_3667_length_1180_cov_97.062441_g3483_i0:127-1122(-)
MKITVGICVLLCALLGVSAKPRTIEIAPGVSMPALLLGTGYVPPKCTPAPACQLKFLDSTAKGNVEAWLAAGGRGIDTAFWYHDQTGIAAAIEASKVPRDEIFVLTKIPGVFNYSAATSYLETDLRNLGGAPLDIVIIHWCGGSQGGGCTMANINATWRAMEDFHKQGKTRAIGISNFCKKDIEMLLSIATIKPHLHQFERNPFYQQKEMSAFCKGHNIPIMDYAPLADADRMSGQGPKAGSLLVQPTILKIAAAHSITPAQVVLQWHLQAGHSGSPRVGGTTHPHPNVAHMKENLAVLNGEVPELTDAEMEEMNAIPEQPKSWPVGQCQN